MASTRRTKRARQDSPQCSADEVVEIDPEGDLVLRSGADPGLLMRVSSKHLTVVSKVFKTLLGPNFSEGQIQHDTSNPVALPDDNAEAMLLMCRLAHHAITEVDEIRPKELQSLVIVCDKYDCTTAFKIYFHSILAKWLADHEVTLSEYDTTTTYAGLHILNGLCIAYLAQDAQSFKKLSRCVFEKATINLIEGKISKDLVAAMPDGFAACLSDELRKAIQEAVGHFRSPLNALDRHIGSLTDPTCAVTHQRAGEYALHLAHHGFLSTYSVQKYNNIVNQMPWYGTRLRKSVEHIPRCSDTCKYCKYDFDAAIDTAVKDARVQMGYLCLVCVREGSYKRTIAGCGKHKS